MDPPQKTNKQKKNDRELHLELLDECAVNYFVQKYFWGYHSHQRQDDKIKQIRSCLAAVCLTTSSTRLSLHVTICSFWWFTTHLTTNLSRTSVSCSILNQYLMLSTSRAPPLAQIQTCSDTHPDIFRTIVPLKAILTSTKCIWCGIYCNIPYVLCCKSNESV